MKQAAYHRFDPVHPLDVHAPETVPDPGAPGPGQVRVAMHYAPVHPCDVLCAMGVVNGVALPAVGGTEGMGVVVAVAPDLADRFRPGQRVHVSANHVFGVWQSWQGTWREQMLCLPEALIPVPDGVSDADASQFMVNPLTAFAMVKTFGLGPGKTLLQSAGASVLGQLMNQLARVHGFDLVNLVRREASAAQLRRDFGTRAYVYDGTEDSARGVREALRADQAGRPVDFCIEAVGGDTARLCLDLLGPGGEFYAYGALSGDITFPVNIAADLAMANNTLRGWSTQEVWMRRTPDAVKRAYVDELWSLFADGRLTMPAHGEVFPLDRVHDAVAASVAPGREGKILLRLSPD